MLSISIKAIPKGATDPIDKQDENGMALDALTVLVESAHIALTIGSGARLGEYQVLNLTACLRRYTSSGPS